MCLQLLLRPPESQKASPSLPFPLPLSFPFFPLPLGFSKNSLSFLTGTWRCECFVEAAMNQTCENGLRSTGHELTLKTLFGSMKAHRTWSSHQHTFTVRFQTGSALVTSPVGFFPICFFFLTFQEHDLHSSSLNLPFSQTFLDTPLSTVHVFHMAPRHLEGPPVLQTPPEPKNEHQKSVCSISPPKALASGSANRHRAVTGPGC